MAEKLLLANWSGIDVDDLAEVLVNLGLKDGIAKQVADSVLVLRKAVKAFIAIKTGNPGGTGPEGGGSEFSAESVQEALLRQAIDRWLATSIQINRHGTLWLLSRVQHLDP